MSIIVPLIFSLQLIESCDGCALPLQLWQIRLMLAFYKRVSQSSTSKVTSSRLLSDETMTSVCSELNHFFNKNLQGMSLVVIFSYSTFCVKAVFLAHIF